jgi:hypothetical protein
MQESLDPISPILPMDFFGVTVELKEGEWGKLLKKKHALPDFSELLYEDPFATVFLAWHQKGLLCQVEFSKPFEECYYPQFQKGEAIELFIDTRDLKTAGFVTKFCHHFVILPKPVDDVRALEVTAFRTDDRHELADGDKIKVDATFKSRSFIVRMELPAECLHGYNPSHFDRLGFAYRISGVDRDPMHFALSSKNLAIESLPSKWTSMEMR